MLTTRPSSRSLTGRWLDFGKSSCCISCTSLTVFLASSDCISGKLWLYFLQEFDCISGKFWLYFSSGSTALTALRRGSSPSGRWSTVDPYPRPRPDLPIPGLRGSTWLTRTSWRTSGRFRITRSSRRSWTTSTSPSNKLCWSPWLYGVNKINL